MSPKGKFLFTHPGLCPVCEKRVTFSADGPYFRNTLTCPACRSLPRNRALMTAINMYKPAWRSLAIHESSPAWDHLSRRLFEESASYTASQFRPDLPFGSEVDAPQFFYQKYVNIDLEKQDFPDGHFDLVVTQDVLEHIFRPDLAIREIARTLRPGGAFISTVPIVCQNRPSQRRAALRDGAVEHYLPAEYHGNPVSSEGALVTIDWGFDIAAYLTAHSGMSVFIVSIKDASAGILGELAEVVVGLKAPLPEL